VYGTPKQSTTTLNWSDASNPDEYGVAFTLPTGMCSTYKIKGIQAPLLSSAGGVFDVTLYSGTTALQTRTEDGDLYTSANNWDEVIFSGTLSSLSAGTEYIIGIHPTTNSLLWYRNELNASADQDAYAFGTAVYGVNRNAAGAWNLEAANRYFVNLLLEDRTGGGGGIIIGG
jgi:hypothetical protein